MEEGRRRRLLSLGLSLASAAALAVSLLAAWLFYEFYLRWAARFEGGRYFDPETGVVYHDSAAVLGLISLASLVASAALRFAAKAAHPSAVKGERSGDGGKNTVTRPSARP